ncbi:hypothetical protein [Microbacterium sp. CIAB417]|uniref:hypothetical protein n=1 Tax=Microbacterium sp. CIAB417 TaxID=2860287 RepID=UPI001FAC1467|nr:hypothetical protein [Microbacterium sp. CIAB417]
MNTIDASLDERIRAFATAVRAQLDDLPAEDAEDIAVGLVADLVEKAADNDGAIDLDDPAGYAEELRTAAGLPPRSEHGHRIPLRARVRSRAVATVTAIRGSRFGAWVLDLLIALRPVWWVLRGASLYGLLLWFTGNGHAGFWPTGLPGWMILAALTLISVQWGRGRWLPRNALRHIRTIVSIVAAVALPFMFVWMVSAQTQYVDEGYYPPAGLLLDGVQVGNIFAYDAEGNPLQDVQLFTGKGTPLNLHGADTSDYGWQDDREEVTVPLRDFRDQPIWNVYPLREAHLNDRGEVDEDSLAPAPAPFGKATAIESGHPTPEPTPSTSPEPAETPTP